MSLKSMKGESAKSLNENNKSLSSGNTKGKSSFENKPENLPESNSDKSSYSFLEDI